MTREEVAKALAARELGYVRRTDGAIAMSASDCIENKHFDTMHALCRILYATLNDVWNTEINTDEQLEVQKNRVDATLALLPIEGESDDQVF